MDGSYTNEDRRLIALWEQHVRVEVPLVVVVQLKGDDIVSERIYWDQASVLAQLGLIDASRLPVAGAETARKLLDPTLPSNSLIQRAAAGARPVPFGGPRP